jgi:hypothetical protein
MTTGNGCIFHVIGGYPELSGKSVAGVWFLGFSSPSYQTKPYFTVAEKFWGFRIGSISLIPSTVRVSS